MMEQLKKNHWPIAFGYLLYVKSFVWIFMYLISHPPTKKKKNKRKFSVINCCIFLLDCSLIYVLHLACAANAVWNFYCLQRSVSRQVLGWLNPPSEALVPWIHGPWPAEVLFSLVDFSDSDWQFGGKVQWLES